MPLGAFGLECNLDKSDVYLGHVYITPQEEANYLVNTVMTKQ